MAKKIKINEKQTILTSSDEKNVSRWVLALLSKGHI